MRMTSGNLWFPALIIDLYHEASVLFDATEERLLLSTPISLATIQHIARQKTKSSTPKAKTPSSSFGPSSTPVPKSNINGLTYQVADLQ